MVHTFLHLASSTAARTPTPAGCPHVRSCTLTKERKRSICCENTMLSSLLRSISAAGWCPPLYLEMDDLRAAAGQRGAGECYGRWVAANGRIIGVDVCFNETAFLQVKVYKP